VPEEEGKTEFALCVLITHSTGNTDFLENCAELFNYAPSLSENT
jgi:hypothetical protein